MKWSDAVFLLQSLGYRIDVTEGRIRYMYQGEGNPSREDVTTLLEVLRTNKEQILNDPYFRIEQTLRHINEAWEPGTLAWLKHCRPEQWMGMLRLENEVNLAAIAGDQPRLVKVLEEYKTLIMEAVKLFHTSMGETGDLFQHR